MGVKILLADDSPTVHKVIKIILANEPYEVVECAREADLMPMLAKHKPAVVFLDFNFSENLTGYDLCRSIKDHAEQTKVLMMYGTFDAIDEGVLKDCGADQHVVKPFDTNRFIFQVRALTDSTDSEPADEWNVQDSVEHHEPIERDLPNISKMTDETVSSLDDSLSDWGMNVPGVIGKSEGAPELPPIIGAIPDPIETKTASKPVESAALGGMVAHQAHAPEAQGPQMPDDQDLEYPDFGSGLELEAHAEPEPTHKPKSRLVGLNELMAEPEPEQPSSIELMSHAGMEEDVRNIESQIADEMEADLWSVDSFEEVNPRLSVVKEEKPVFERPVAPTPTPAPAATPAASRAPTNSQITMDLESLGPLIQELVRQAVREYCEQQVDKVAWEVIPDLAENLIRRELQDMARKAAEE